MQIAYQKHAALRAEEISLSFGGFLALDSVDICLQPGRVHAITGENGAGKSSLAKVLSGIYQAHSGRVILGEELVDFASPRAALSRGVALIHQEPLPFPDLSITENIFCGSLPMSSGLVDWKTAHAKAGELMQICGLTLDPKQKATRLSIADQQLLELAAALAHDAKYLIFDETTASLTPQETEKLFGVIRTLTARGCAIAIVTHHLEQVFEIADEVTILRDGKFVRHCAISEITRDEMIRQMVGRDLDLEHPNRASVSGEVALKVHNLSADGVRQISFEIRAGEIYGLSGLVGSGRTEVVRAIFGLSQVYSGTMTLFGKDFLPNSPIDAIHSGVALVPEDRRQDALFSGRSILENTTSASIEQFASKFGTIDKSRERKETENLLEKLKTAMRGIDQPAESLSGGNQQKLILTRWLMNDPKLLILDEPTRGIDIGTKVDVHRLLRDLASRGIATLVVSSDLLEIIALCDRVGVMHGGELVGALVGDAITEEAIMELAAR